MSMIDGISQLLFNVYEAFTVALYVKGNAHLIALAEAVNLYTPDPTTKRINTLATDAVASGVNTPGPPSR